MKIMTAVQKIFVYEGCNWGCGMENLKTSDLRCLTFLCSLMTNSVDFKRIFHKPDGNSDKLIVHCNERRWKLGIPIEKLKNLPNEYGGFLKWELWSFV